MTKTNKNRNKRALAKQFTQLHKSGQRGPSRTTPVHGKGKRLPFKNSIAAQQQDRGRSQREVEPAE